MKSFLSSAVSNYALASSPLPLWMLGPKPNRVGPRTREEHRLHTATLTLVGTNVHRTVAGWSTAHSPSPPRRSMRRTDRAASAAEAAVPPPPWPTASQVIDQVQHANVDEHGTVEWMVHLAQHDDHDVQRAAVATLMAKVLPRLLERALMGSSAEAVALNDLAEQERHADLKAKATDALIQHAIPKWSAMLVGGSLSKLTALQRLTESTNVAVREAASSAVETHHHAMLTEAQADDSWVVIPAPPPSEDDDNDGFAWIHAA